jgi:uncharacterized surface protein with fasciclin (FAS1) repeats
MLKKLPFLLSLVLVLAIATTGVISAKSAEAAPPPSATIVDIALSNPDFSYLVAALVASDTYAGTNYVATLSGNRQFTVFAPTNDAFDAAAQAILNDPMATGPDLVNFLAANNPALLAEVLAYHVTTGRRAANSVLGASQIRMLNGGFTNPSIQNGMPYINDSQIIAANVFAKNGVIHVIDAVLLP